MVVSPVRPADDGGNHKELPPLIRTNQIPFLCDAERHRVFCAKQRKTLLKSFRIVARVILFRREHQARTFHFHKLPRVRGKNVFRRNLLYKCRRVREFVKDTLSVFNFARERGEGTSL